MSVHANEEERKAGHGDGQGRTGNWEHSGGEAQGGGGAKGGFGGGFANFGASEEENGQGIGGFGRKR